MAETYATGLAAVLTPVLSWIARTPAGRRARADLMERYGRPAEEAEPERVNATDSYARSSRWPVGTYFPSTEKASRTLPGSPPAVWYPELK